MTGKRIYPNLEQSVYVAEQVATGAGERFQADAFRIVLDYLLGEIRRTGYVEYGKISIDSSKDATR
jgi:hypothetical protein